MGMVCSVLLMQTICIGSVSLPLYYEADALPQPPWYLTEPCPGGSKTVNNGILTLDKDWTNEPGVTFRVENLDFTSATGVTIDLRVKVESENATPLRFNIQDENLYFVFLLIWPDQIRRHRQNTNTPEETYYADFTQWRTLKIEFQSRQLRLYVDGQSIMDCKIDYKYIGADPQSLTFGLPSGAGVGIDGGPAEAQVDYVRISSGTSTPPVTEVDLYIEDMALTPETKSDCVEFSIRVRNNGPGDAHNVTVELWQDSVLKDSENHNLIRAGSFEHAHLVWSTKEHVTNIFFRADCQEERDINLRNNSKRFLASWYYDSSGNPFDFSEDAYGFSNAELNAWKNSSMHTDVWNMCINILGESLGALAYVMIAPKLEPFQTDGYCYGMASTSILYKHDPGKIPEGVTHTHDLFKPQAINNIEKYQASQVEHWFRALSCLGKGYDGNQEYQSLRNSLSTQGKAMMLSGEKHSVCAFAILELKGTSGLVTLKEKNIIYYDNNNPNKAKLYEFCDKGLFSDKKLFADTPIEDYSPGLKAKIIDLVDTISASLEALGQSVVYLRCPAHMILVDQDGHTTGYINGVYIEDIPGSEVITIEDEEFIIVPDNLQYNITITGTDVGTCDFGIISPSTNNDRVDYITWTDLPLESGSTITLRSFANGPATDATTSFGGVYEPERESVVTSGTLELTEPVESELWIFPSVINRRRGASEIMAVIRLPEGITRGQIEESQPLMLYPGNIEATYQRSIQWRRRGGVRTTIFAYFDKRALMGAVPQDGRVELQVEGELTTNKYFYGKDTVRVVDWGWWRRPWWDFDD
jgi:hypothetical protein